MNVKRQAFIGSVWSVLGSGGRQLIAFVLFIYVARNLTPADLGLVALAMILIDLIGFASKFGQIELLQRKPDLTDRTINTSFWLLAVSGPVMTIAVLAGVAVAAEVTGEISQFLFVVILLAPICTLQAWTAVPEALFKRRFDYRSLATRTWLATIVGGIFGVYLAVNGHGVYALVAQRLASSTVQTFTMWAMVGWKPRFAFDRGQVAGLIRTGGGILFAKLAGIVNKRVVDGITGAVLGLSQLGSFRLGWRFFDFIVQFSVTPLSSVALSTFNTIQNEKEKIKRAYLRLTQFVALGSLPAFFGLGAVADLAIPVLLGDKWQDSIVVMQLLGFVMLGGVVNFFFGSALIAIGRVNVMVRQSAMQILATAILVLIGAQFGIVGVILAVIARALLVAAYNMTALHREIGLRPADFLRTLMPPVVASGLMVAAVRFAMLELGGTMPDLLLLVVLVALGAVTYGAALLLGDFCGLWRGYLRSAVDSLAGALVRRTASPKPA